MSPSANGNGVAHSAMPTSEALAPGLYVPTVAFFTSEDAVDEAATKKHAAFLAKSGVAGIVTHGSNGEAVNLSHEERSLITKLTREALTEAGCANLPIIAGCGAQSTREVIQLCKEAKDVTATHALVLPPSYYGSLQTNDSILKFYRDIADASPIPLVIYNYPGACSGMDLNSDQILALAEHPNIVGVKLTCGNTGKLARIVGGTLDNANFRTFGGSADFLLQTLAVGGHGVIGGLGNVTPKSCIQLIKLWKTGKYDAARTLQYAVARGDWVAIKGGLVAVKVALSKYYGYGGGPRAPLGLPTGEALKAQEDGFAELMGIEKTL